MATPRQLGINRFIWIKVASTWQLIGCCNKVSPSLSVETQKYLCQATGNTSQKVPGERNTQVTLGGVHIDYTSGEETTNWSVADWEAAAIAGTELEFFIGAATTASSAGERFLGVVTSVGSEHGSGAVSTWDVTVDVNGDKVPYTIPT